MSATNAYKNAMTESDRALLKAYGDEWNAARAAGSAKGMSLASEKAEALRAQYGYSGGSDGSGYISTQKPSESSYVDALTEAQRQAGISSLRRAYDENVYDLEAERAELQSRYDAAAGDARTQAAIKRSAWNEYAAGSGLNSGAGGQAALASSAALQSELSGINLSRAQAQAELNSRAAQLESQYKTAIRAAIENGEADRAEKLYALAKSRATVMARVGSFADYSGLGYSPSQIYSLQRAYEIKNGA